MFLILYSVSLSVCLYVSVSFSLSVFVSISVCLSVSVCLRQVVTVTFSLFQCNSNHPLFCGVNKKKGSYDWPQPTVPSLNLSLGPRNGWDEGEVRQVGCDIDDSLSSSFFNSRLMSPYLHRSLTKESQSDLSFPFWSTLSQNLLATDIENERVSRQAAQPIPSYVRRVDPSVLAFSFSLYRHPHIWIPFRSRFICFS